jgi:Ni/Fe-hydrogenase subunit HybB-like protein
MIEVWYDVPHLPEWGALIAMYFYFTGLSAGTFVVSALGTAMGVEKYKPLAKYASLIAFLLLLVAPTILLIDLEQPTRFYTLFYHFNPTSVMSWGTYLLTWYPIVCLVYTYYLWKKPEAKKTIKILGMIGVPSAIAVHGYTGFIFGVVKARAFWYTALQPSYFLASALVSGFGLMIAVVILLNKFVLSEEGKKQIPIELAYDLGRMLLYILAVDLFFVGTQLLVTLNGSADAVAAATYALHDPLFVWGELVMGAIVPFILLVLPQTRRSLAGISAASILVIIGVFIVRWSLVHIGQAIPLS